MPNWITNYVEIKGDKDKLDELIEVVLKHDTAADAYEFDFNGIIPMPEEIVNTSSPVTIVETQAEADRINAEWKTSALAKVKTSEVRAITKDQAERWLRQYGATDWYDWSLKHWGTKWNAREAIVLHRAEGRLVVQFDTPWSPPEQIFDKLVTDGFEVNCMWQDEDQSNHGEYGEPWSVFQRNIEYEFLG